MRSAALLALAVCAPAEAKAKASKDLPSFLFMLGDDIGWADMGYAGGESCGSPSAVCCRSVACFFLCCFFALAARADSARTPAGTAHTPNIDAWAKAKGSIMMHDFHSVRLRLPSLFRVVVGSVAQG